MGFLFFISLLIFFFLFFMSCLKTFRVLWTNSNSVSTVQWPIPWRDCIIYSGTDYGLLMAISQILFGQYHIWDIFWLGLKTKVFLWKKQLNDGNHEQGTHSAKMGADSSSAENTPNTPKFIRPICPKVWDIVKKGFIGRPQSVYSAKTAASVGKLHFIPCF